MRQRVGGKHIVLIEERAPLAARQTQCRVRAGGDMAIVRAEDDFDSPIKLGDLFEPGAHFLAARCIVGQAKLPTFVNLPSNRVDRRLEKKEVGIVNRHNHRNKRLLA